MKPRLRYLNVARVWLCWSIEETTKEGTYSCTFGWSLRSPTIAFYNWQAREEIPGHKMIVESVELFVGKDWQVGLQNHG